MVRATSTVGVVTGWGRDGRKAKRRKAAEKVRAGGCCLARDHGVEDEEADSVLSA